MEKRNIQLTLEEARKLYNEGDSTMKSLILTSFTEDELLGTFHSIKSFEDACEALGLVGLAVECDLCKFRYLEETLRVHLTAILYKVDSKAEICFRILNEEVEDLPIGGVLEQRVFIPDQEGYNPIITTVYLTKYSYENQLHQRALSEDAGSSDADAHP